MSEVYADERERMIDNRNWHAMEARTSKIDRVMSIFIGLTLLGSSIAMGHESLESSAVWAVPTFITGFYSIVALKQAVEEGRMASVEQEQAAYWQDQLNYLNDLEPF